MTGPVFEEYEPAADCSCAGCARQRRELALGRPARAGGHPAARGARRVLVLMTAAGVVLGAGGGGGGAARAATRPADPPPPAADPYHEMPAQQGDGAGSGTDDNIGHLSPAPATTPAPAPAWADPYDPPGADDGTDGDDPPGADDDGSTPQGGTGPLHGRPGSGPVPGHGSAPSHALRKLTRAEIIERAKTWLAAKVPYSMTSYWTDGYRQDCSGYVSMAWALPGNEWTGSLDRFGTRIERAALEPGDILLFHNPADPTTGSHVTIFGGWVDATHAQYYAYEQVKPHTRYQATPMAYWSNSDRYVAYRYQGLSAGAAGAPATGATAGSADAYPGAAAFGPGANNAHVARLGRMLVQRGGARFYASGPGPLWSEADRLATQAFQRAQGWTGAEADGLPGPDTWRLLVTGTGRDIQGVTGAATGSTTGIVANGVTGAVAGGATGHPGPQASAPPYPGRGYFRPGQVNEHVERLGRRLVERGFGAHYPNGPGRAWTEADRRGVEAFQRAQGWRGGAADGYPGPETWRRLFR
ncbi:peptidoglycan-binding protein [Streptomyces sp. LP05-1]|uniref:Peptidoglycan-binding protein n=1 Tax=Streptomyces pyxinae TaxID=2970734 RepID=A0ABT2CDD3_9ACTN|nr:peptidoglycan-binding protein [Streptomyces sp. LP05-1]MCS0634624.1 peptidoglycan-binding protein [Streptomyces sp. LP05-1]